MKLSALQLTKNIFLVTQILNTSKFIISYSHQQFKNINKNFWVINPGSLGQNRKYK